MPREPRRAGTLSEAVGDRRAWSRRPRGGQLFVVGPVLREILGLPRAPPELERRRAAGRGPPLAGVYAIEVDVYGPAGLPPACARPGAGRDRDLAPAVGVAGLRRHGRAVQLRGARPSRPPGSVWPIASSGSARRPSPASVTPCRPRGRDRGGARLAEPDRGARDALLVVRDLGTTSGGRGRRRGARRAAGARRARRCHVAPGLEHHCRSVTLRRSSRRRAVPRGGDLGIAPGFSLKSGSCTASFAVVKRRCCPGRGAVVALADRHDRRVERDVLLSVGPAGLRGVAPRRALGRARIVA